MMMTAASALYWEVRRALRFRLLLTFWALLIVAGSTLLPIFGRQYRGYHELGPELWRTSPVVHLSVTVINLGICLFGIGQAVGMSTRQYSLPITSRQLAAVRLLPGAVWCAGLYLILCTLFNTLFAAGWPYLGPALTYGVSYMVVYSTVYRFRGNENLTGLAVALTMIGITFWIHGHYPRQELDDWLLPWIEFSFTELVVLTITGVLSWLGLVDAIERDRRGTGWGRVILRNVVEPASGTIRRPRRPFWSAVSATFWFEWKQDGWLVPCVVTGLTAVFAICNVGYELRYRDDRPNGPVHQLELMFLVCAIIPICCASPSFSSLISNHGKRATSQRLWPTFQSTLPVSDGALGWIVFTRCLVSTLLSLVGALVMVAIWMAAIELVVPPDVSKESLLLTFRQNGFWEFDVAIYIAIVTFIAWMTAGLATAAALSGRRWIAAVPLGIIPVWIFFVLVSSALPHPEREVFTWSVINVILGWSLVGMLIAYSMGTAREVIGVRSWLAGGCALVVAEFVVFALSSWGHAIAHSQGGSGAPAWVQLYFLVVAALAAAPPAIVPLAAYYNRHR